MAKLKMRKNVRVMLKSNKSNDGKIVGTEGRASWSVTWSLGPLAGTTTKQSSKSLTFWTALDARPPSEDEEDEEGNDEAISEVDEADDRNEEHAVKKAKFESFRRELVGVSVTAKGTGLSKGKTLTWTYVEPTHFKQDYFPTLPGPVGLAEPPKQMAVLKGYTFRDKKGDMLAAFQLLYPGDMTKDVAKVNEAMAKAQKNPAELTVGEWVVFLSLLVGATLQKQSGHALWDPVEERPFTRGHPGFADYMRRRRFDEIKSSCTAAFSDEDLKGTDPWFQFRPGVDAFNANRFHTVLRSKALIPDEAISPIRPRTTADGGLPNITFVERKPKPCGTEFKCVADGRHGVMLYLEIQEGAVRMALKRFRDELAPASSIGVRMALGTTGKL